MRPWYTGEDEQLDTTVADMGDQTYVPALFTVPGRSSAEVEIYDLCATTAY